MEKVENPIEYVEGGVYLWDLCGDNTLDEVEIIAISKNANAVKTDKNGWMDANQFSKKVKGMIGYAKYFGWLFPRRLVIYRRD